jgi:hypothetical protein
MTFTLYFNKKITFDIQSNPNKVANIKLCGYNAEICSEFLGKNKTNKARILLEFTFDKFATETFRVDKKINAIFNCIRKKNI